MVELRNLTTGRVDTAVSWLDGTFKFKLDPNTDYSVAGTRDGYFTNSEEVSTVGKRQSENMFVSLKLELEEIEFPLVDEIGGLDRAIELAKQKAKIAATDKITLVPYPPRRSLFELLMERGSEAVSLDSLASEVETRWVESQMSAPVQQALRDMPVRSLAEGGILRLMPYSVRVE